MPAGHGTKKFFITIKLLFQVASVRAVAVYFSLVLYLIHLRTMSCHLLSFFENSQNFTINL